MCEASATKSVTEYRVTDEYSVLTEEDIQRISDQAIKSSEALDIQLAAIITADMKGQSSEDYADDYADRYFPNEDCMVLLINMNDREIWISTAGRAKDIYDSYTDAMSDDVYNKLQNEEYDHAIEVFIQDADYYYEEANSADSVTAIPDDTQTITSSYDRTNRTEYATSSQTEGSSITVSFWMIIVALLLAGGVTYGVTISSRGKRTISARTYEAGNSFVLNRSVDDYLRETTTRRRIPKNNSSSGGGRSGGGSGSRSHGGGGRKF